MKATILCYHKVGPGSEEGRRLNIEPERLNSHVRFYSRRGIPFLCAGELGKHTAGKAVCFTFDDAYASALTHVPVLFARVHQRATFYVVTQLAGATSSWDRELAKPLGSFDMLREAQAAGHEIGNHTSTHPHLGELSAEDQARQIIEAHESLTSEGLSVSTICYPFGSYDDATLAVARSLGYTIGMSLRKGLMTPRSPLLELPRIVVAFSDALPMLIYKATMRARMRFRAG